MQTPVAKPAQLPFLTPENAPYLLAGIAVVLFILLVLYVIIDSEC
jgi:hypothetical protein